MDCVVDASVGIKLFVKEDGSAGAQRLFERLADDPPARFYVPDLFFSECANVLWKYVRFYDYPAENARQDVKDLRALVLQTVSTSDLLTPALAIAVEHEITVYDACYTALAQMLELPLITADQVLIGKSLDIGVQVQTLKEISL
jgi:predicted nucleic acid-binding protein